MKKTTKNTAESNDHCEFCGKPMKPPYFDHNHFVNSNELVCDECGVRLWKETWGHLGDAPPWAKGLTGAQN